MKFGKEESANINEEAITEFAIFFWDKES